MFVEVSMVDCLLSVNLSLVTCSASARSFFESIVEASKFNVLILVYVM